MRRTAEAPPPDAVELEGKPPRWIEYVPVREVVGADANPKDHDADLLDGSVLEHGFVEPPQLDERTGKLIAGHGRLETLQRAEARGEPPDGYEGPWPPEGIVIRESDGWWLMPQVRGWASRDDTQAKAYLIVANQSTIKPGWKPRPLAEYLHDLDRGVVRLESIGFDDAGYDKLLQETGLKGELEGDFLSDLDSGEPGSGPGGPRGRQGATDVVDLRLPMKDRDRDDAVALLRKHQRALSDLGRPAGSLSETFLEIVRTWRPE